MKTLSITVFTVFAGLACAASPRSTDTAAVQPSARDLALLIEAHDAAWNAHDATALADLFVADGSAGVEELGSAHARMVALTRRVHRKWRFVEAHVLAVASIGKGAP